MSAFWNISEVRFHGRQDRFWPGTDIGPDMTPEPAIPIMVMSGGCTPGGRGLGAMPGLTFFGSQREGRARSRLWGIGGTGGTVQAA
jgi:hypothetical protein